MHKNDNQQVGISQKTNKLSDATSLFFGKILPSHRILSEDAAEEALRAMASRANPEYILRVPSLDDLKAAILAKVESWNAEQSIYEYEVKNVNGGGEPDNWATFDTRSKNPEHKIERRGIFSTEIRWRGIHVWRTQRGFLAWSGFPWPDTCPNELSKGRSADCCNSPQKSWWQFWK